MLDLAFLQGFNGYLVGDKKRYNRMTENNITKRKQNEKDRPQNKNLKPFNPNYDNHLTTEEAQRRGRLGAIKSAETKRARKTMRENILAMLSQEVDPSKLEDYGVDTSTLNGDYTIQNAIVSALLREAMQGDSKSIQLMRDTIGEMPTIKTENKTEVITKEDVQTMDNLRKYLTG